MRFALELEGVIDIRSVSTRDGTMYMTDTGKPKVDMYRPTGV